MDIEGGVNNRPSSAAMRAEATLNELKNKKPAEGPSLINNTYEPLESAQQLGQDLLKGYVEQTRQERAANLAKK